jgi:PAS domain S-box-containing protein
MTLAMGHNKNKIETRVFDSSHDSVFILDGDGKCVDVNNAACPLTGYSREELLGMSVRDLIPADDTTSIPGEFLTLRETGALTAHLHLIKKQGGLIPVKLNAVKIPDGNYIVFCTDITEIRQAEDMLLKSRQQLSIITDNIPALVTCISAGDLVQVC